MSPSTNSPGFLSPSMRTARLLNATGVHALVSRILIGMALFALGVMFLPWQQNVQGNGQVTSLRPEDRPQTVPTLIPGRIDKWHVAEGEFVKKGTLLVTISEIKESFLDPKTVARTGEQVTGKEQAIVAKRAKVEALSRQILALEDGQRLGLDQGRNKITQYEAAVRAAEIDSTVALRQLERNQQLFNDGLKSRADLEAYQIKVQSTNAKLVEKRQETDNARIELNSIQAEYQEKIAKAMSDRSATMAEIGEGQADVAKLRMTYSSLQIRNDMYRIMAPQDGYVVRAVRQGIGETLKEGDPVVTVMPSNPQQAVELYVKPMDVPLLSIGRKVRLQFDGWPALQFSGWPSVSVGTFGGVIRVVDYVNSADGKYRILVAADPDDEPWPKELRVGSGVLGWAMLDEVRVWFEIWRKLNGFPPTVVPGENGAAPTKKT